MENRNYKVCFWIVIALFNLYYFLNEWKDTRSKKNNNKIVELQQRQIELLHKENALQKAKIEFLENIRRYHNSNYN